METNLILLLITDREVNKKLQSVLEADFSFIAVANLTEAKKIIEHRKVKWLVAELNNELKSFLEKKKEIFNKTKLAVIVDKNDTKDIMIEAEFFTEIDLKIDLPLSENDLHDAKYIFKNLS